MLFSPAYGFVMMNGYFSHYMNYDQNELLYDYDFKK